MSRYYSMAVTIIGANLEQIEAVKQAAEAVWPFDDWFLDIEDRLVASANDHLCAGRSEEELAQDLAKAIWAANGGYCPVEVAATYLEDLPYETYCFDEDNYRELGALPRDPKNPEEVTDGEFIS